MQRTGKNIEYKNGLTHLLELIRVCNENIDELLQSGEPENSFVVRQELYIKHRFCADLNELLEKYNLGIKVVELENVVRKAA